MLIWNTIIGQFFHPLGGKGMGKGGGCWIVVLDTCEFYFIRVNENMVQHQSNNLSITIIVLDIFHVKRGGENIIKTVYLYMKKEII